MPEKSIVLGLAVSSVLRVIKGSGLSAVVIRSIVLSSDENTNKYRCYLAVEITHPLSNLCAVHGYTVTLRSASNGDLITGIRVVSEFEGPEAEDCPPYILEVLSPTDDPIAIAWRKKCASKEWRYELLVTMQDNDERTIDVKLSMNGTEATVHSVTGIRPHAFDAVYTAVSDQFIMSSIALV